VASLPADLVVWQRVEMVEQGEKVVLQTGLEVVAEEMLETLVA
jgi:hypothetical protein